MQEVSLIETKVDSSYHEELTDLNSNIAKVNLSSIGSINFKLSGQGSDDFQIDSNGNIKLINSFDYDRQSLYDLRVIAESGNEKLTIPISINVQENLSPDFKANCISSCSFAENSRLNSVLVNFQRTDADTDQISYSLRDSFNGKFKIDSDSGEIRLGKKLDFESSASYELEVFATDETGIEVKKDISIN